MPILPIEQIQAGLAADPSIYPQNLNLAREALLFVRLDQAALQGASFLDDRILTPQTLGRWVRFAELAPLIDGLAPLRPLHFIFHAGHVGSTLVSRLLDETGKVLSLREPATLRALAEAADEAAAPHALADAAQVRTLLRWLSVLWARGYPDSEAVVLKATSSAGRMAPALLEITPDARAIYLGLKPEPYIATLLSGDNSYIDLRGHGPERHRRLARLAAPAPTPLHAMSLGEIAALTWLVETLTQKQAKQTHGERVLALDFDDVLADPSAAMRAVCTHFGIAATEDFFANVLSSPVLQRYSKAPDVAYTPAVRAQLLAQSRSLNAVEIRKGLAWLDAFAQRAPAAASVLST